MGLSGSGDSGSDSGGTAKSADGGSVGVSYGTANNNGTTIDNSTGGPSFLQSLFGAMSAKYPIAGAIGNGIYNSVNGNSGQTPAIPAQSPTAQPVPIAGYQNVSGYSPDFSMLQQNAQPKSGGGGGAANVLALLG